MKANLQKGWKPGQLNAMKQLVTVTDPTGKQWKKDVIGRVWLLA